MKRIILVFYLLLISQVFLFSLNIEHNAKLEYNLESKDQIDIFLKGNIDEVISAKIMIKSLKEINFKEFEMNQESELLPEFGIPVSAFDIEGQFTYYFVIETQSDGIKTLPATNPIMNAYQADIIVEESISKDFILISPDPDYPTDEIIMAVSIYGISDQLDMNSIIVTDNGKNVTNDAGISSNMIIYDLSKAGGSHNVQIAAKKSVGTLIKSSTWQLGNVMSKSDAHFNYSGDVMIRTKYQSETVDDDESDSDSRTDLTMNFKGNYKKFDVKSRIFLSSLEDNDSQPVNRYRLEMKVPHFKLTAGDHSPNHNTLMISGKNIRGIHNKLFFPGFALYTTYGISKRQIDGKREDDDPNDQDYSPGVFKRSSFIVRTELGNKRIFQVGLNFTKTKDIVNSLNKKYYLSAIDSTHIALPKDNLVLGVDTRLALMNQKLIWGNEFALSLYNDDIIDGAISKDSLEAEFGSDLPFDPEGIENLFVINKNVEPILPSLSSMAYNTYLKFIHKNNLFNISYRGVGASYRALSSNYLGLDSKVLSIFDNVNLMGNRLNLSLGYNYISDNLYDEKEETTRSNNFFTQIYYRPQNLPFLGLSYSGFTAKNSYKTEVYDDSLAFSRAIDLNSTNVNIYTGYKIRQLEKTPTTVNLSFGNSNYKDEENGQFEYKKQTFGLSANTAFSEIPLKTVISYTFTKNENEMEDSLLLREGSTITENSYHSFYLKGRMRFIEDKVKPYFHVRYNNETDEIKSSSMYVVLGSTYKVMKQFVISGETGFKNRSFDDVAYSDSNGFSFKLKVKYKF